MLILFIEITSPFLKTPYKQKTKKLSNNLSNFYEKHTKQKVIKKTTKIHLKSYLMFYLQVFSFKIYMDFQKDRAKWQRSVVNCQRLTPRLTTPFS